MVHYKQNKKLYIFSVMLFFMISNVRSQSILDDLAGGSDDYSSSLVSETIKQVSPTKRIFVLSNDNNLMEKGDFVSLVTLNKVTARAIVAKINKDNLAGLKIIKIHSLTGWNTLKKNSLVQIIKGDDSYFKMKKKKKEESSEDFKIESEDDLYSNTNILDDDLSIDENKNRSIKTDNLISGGYGTVSAGGAREALLNISWAYQIDDNIFIEGLYGQTIIQNFPTDGLDTKLSNITIRGKYTISAPFYSYVQPYIGFQILSASSPGAGTDDGVATPEELQLEIDDVEALQKNTLVFGATWLKRLVPGWFLRADLGSDIISAGFSLEF